MNAMDLLLKGHAKLLDLRRHSPASGYKVRMMLMLSRSMAKNRLDQATSIQQRLETQMSVVGILARGVVRSGLKCPNCGRLR